MTEATIVVMLALGQYLYFGLRVGSQRGRSGVQAPAVVGDEVFERYFRAHQNTLEQLVIFVPAAYAAALFIDPWYTVGAGALFLLGRGLYFNRYVRAPGKRGPGMLMTMVANLMLILGGLVGAFAELI